ncbi:hypothetical protein [Pontibacter sp. SGAir0037]|uniref:hypothetical protein n=1 Tax=Pontibacter sp. SGAir0037 TaxID=2571030 RepID=UPI0010CD352A|nr:hypothetical protein [Pontibacter sp. SGAir0037]QCR22242.1 hypothetical protein C1N53_07730 [Pontibacter sp. SGAir0037]
MKRAEWIALCQGLYWTVPGVWPLIHMPSFIWVTGPKVDLWLVRTVSILLVVIGLVLLFAAVRRRVTPEIKWLGIGGAAGMAYIDFYYSLIDRIRNVYMLDGVLEIILIILWLWAGKKGVQYTSRPDTT